MKKRPDICIVSRSLGPFHLLEKMPLMVGDGGHRDGSIKAMPFRLGQGVPKDRL
ncbi:hypothetical protein [Dyella japonica]|uniref:hypothetical protein n=1 Tax=Dyella japonica TaxID=231455 RepID=UPI0012FE78F1|nr:hypothetical protein [Dyella japonica]